MKVPRIHLALLASLALVVETASAGGIDTYDAPVSGSDLLQTPRAHAELGHLQPFGRLSLAYNDDPLVWRDGSGNQTRVIHQQFGAYGAIGLALWRRLQIAALIPLYYQAGDERSVSPSADGFALGDAALDLRFALLQQSDVIELALASRIALPIGDRDRFVGDGHTAATLGAIVSREFGKNGVLLTSNISANVRNRSAWNGDQGTSEALLGLGVALPIADAFALTGEGAIATQFSHFLGGAATPASLLAGARYHLGSWMTGLGIGPGLSRGVGTPDFRIVGMIGTNSEVAEPAPTAINPEHESKPSDSDGDGIADVKDACPQEAEDNDHFKDEDGCPELDDDRDGIPDAVDKCRLEPEDRDAFEDEDGCAESDNDQDGIADGIDACPLQAEDKDAFKDEDGCPEADNDEDGIADAGDKCPNEKETANGIDDEDGCPDLLRVEQEQIRTLEPIYFERGSDRLQARSLPLVKELASVIASREDLGMISIEGHTDNAGGERANQVLSQKRAETIKNTLVENGVPVSRLTAIGYGEMRPIASNETRQGREQNRRVEFRLADVVGAPAATSEGTSQ
ncbi:MAG TPA: OmpA family protein [Polyangiaceae bacterium]|nr:OmpA family protein [Polyangiaceae bacterium]